MWATILSLLYLSFFAAQEDRSTVQGRRAAVSSVEFLGACKWTARRPPPINAAQLGVEHHNERPNTLTAVWTVGLVSLPSMPRPATDKPQPSPSVLDRRSGRPSPQSRSAMLRQTPRPTRTSRTRCSRSICSSKRLSAQQQRQRSPSKMESAPRSRPPHSAMAPHFPSPRRCSLPSV